MDYRSRKISIHNEKLEKLIRQLSEGTYLIPTFQRSFVWNPDDVRNLWSSIYQCYPIGSILYWKTDILLHVHRKLGGFYIPENGNEDQTYRSYILDGQQRATSLCASFYGGTGKIRDRYTFDFTMYFDLKNESFFFEKEYYRHRWDADSALLIRLGDVPDLPADYARHLPEASPDIERNLDQLRYMFAHYDVPMICLEGYDIPSVCQIFERINQTGIRLDNLDILIARSFENCDTVVEEDFPIRE